VPNRRHDGRTKLHRLARSLPDARDVVAELTDRGCVSRPVGRCTIGPVRSGGCCSTCWRWLQYLRLTLVLAVRDSEQYCSWFTAHVTSGVLTEFHIKAIRRGTIGNC
jgi:hypothetical protein